MTPDQARPTLVMTAHVSCPCTHASVSELARLASDLRGAVNIVVLFTGEDERTARSSGLWKRASLIPGATLIADPKSEEVARFGTRSSGATLLYSADGLLLFHGGLTSSRGHEGRSIGGSRIRAIVRGSLRGTSHSDVFGCALPQESTP